MMSDDIGQRISDVMEHFALEMMRHESGRLWKKLPPIVLDHRKFCVMCQVRAELRKLELAEPEDDR